MLLYRTVLVLEFLQEDPKKEERENGEWRTCVTLFLLFFAPAPLLYVVFFVGVRQDELDGCDLVFGFF